MSKLYNSVETRKYTVAPSFQVHNYETRDLDWVMLASTKLAFFYKGAVIFNNNIK